MRISFDLDDTLICFSVDVSREPSLPWLLRLFVYDEPLRSGTCRLIRELQSKGHEVWIYTTSLRKERSVRFWLWAHGIHVTRVVNGAEHANLFGLGTSPSKQPHKFGIDLHVDDSEGVAIEGEQHGFLVCTIKPADSDWVEIVLAAVDEVDAIVETRNEGR